MCIYLVLIGFLLLIWFIEILNVLFVRRVLILILFYKEYFLKWGVFVIFIKKCFELIKKVVKMIVDIGFCSNNKLEIINCVVFV